jgi:hypothetical protein
MTHDSEPKQKEFDFDRYARTDFDRGQQLAMLRHVALRPVTIIEGKTKRCVKPRDMIAVLRALDDHGRDCWPSVRTIAKESRLSRCQVLRAIAALQSLSLLCVEKRPKRGGGFTNRYVIVWSELALLCPGDTLKLKAVHSPQGSNHHPQRTNHGPQATKHRPHVGTRSAKGSVHSSAQGDGERERLIVLVAKAGVFDATKAVDAALAHGVTANRIAALTREHSQKALFDVLTNATPEVSGQAPRVIEHADAERQRLIQTLRYAGYDNQRINEQLQARGFDGIAVEAST